MNLKLFTVYQSETEKKALPHIYNKHNISNFCLRNVYRLEERGYAELKASIQLKTGIRGFGKSSMSNPITVT